MTNTNSILVLAIEKEIETIVKNDQYSEYISIKNAGNYNEGNSYFIPIIIHNDNAKFDMFSFTFQLENQANGNTYISAKYGNQNTYQTINFGSLQAKSQDDLISNIHEEFIKKFRHSKGDLEQLSR